MVLRLATLLPTNWMRVVESDQARTVGPVQGERIIDAVGFSRRHRHPRHDELDLPGSLSGRPREPVRRGREAHRGWGRAAPSRHIVITLKQPRQGDVQPANSKQFRIWKYRKKLPLFLCLLAW